MGPLFDLAHPFVALDDRERPDLSCRVSNVPAKSQPIRVGYCSAIQDFYTEDCVLHVPPGVFVGHDALDKFAGDLRAIHPHFVYTPHGEPQALHNGGILAWGSGPKGETPDYSGLDVVIVRDGKIAALYVFLNPKFA
jgi:SnoaL-like domain